MNSAGNMRDIFPFFGQFFDVQRFFGCFFFPRELKHVARWFACHANIWPFAASVASTWAFSAWSGGWVDMRKNWNGYSSEYGGQCRFHLSCG